MKFSIITICLNDKCGLKKTVESVKMQELKEYEHIIIDGASSDGTIEMVQSLQDNHIKFYSEPDEGISDAFNKGIKKSQGDVLLFLNAGDYFCTSDILGRVVEAFKKYDSDIIFFAVQGKKYTIPKRIDEAASVIWKQTEIPHQAAFIKKEVFEQVGLYNKYIKIRMDYDFFMRCVKAHISYTYIPEIIVFYKGDGISERDNRLFDKEGMAIRLLYTDVLSVEETIIDEQISKAQKFRDMFLCAKNWILLKQRKLKTSECLGLQNDMKIAIYGAGYIGQLLFSELQIESIPVEYYIDVNKNIMTGNVKIINPDEIEERLDVVIVTTMSDHAFIFEKLNKAKIKRIVVLKDILEKEIKNNG